MTAMPARVSRVHEARDLFFAEGRSPEGQVPPHITRSWLRCRDHDPHPDRWLPLAAARVDERRHAARTLRDCARPELDGLVDHLVATGCVAVLCGPDGVILDEVGSPDFLPRAEQVALRPGADWREDVRGTNAIGTVLVERVPLAVLGGEHFLADNGALGCAAAPVFDGAGAIAGVLDLSGDPAALGLHALGLVRLAARQIEHRLLLATARGQLLRFHTHAGLLGSAREGLLAVEDGHVVSANAIGLDLLGETWASLLGQPVERLLGRPWSRVAPDPGRIVLPSGTALVATVDAAAPREAAARRSNAASPRPAIRPEPPPPDPLDALLGTAVRVLDAGVPVLVTGETGVGKEVFAGRLHAAGRRHRGPFVAVNCAALPESLIEAELFGYEDGAFTGARRRGAPGRLREAHGGLLFLDEIGDMPLAMQTRLLRVLETRTVTPLGGGRAVPVDFDLVCATHGDLPRMAAAGTFRSDLLYRIAGYGVVLPPLRARCDRRALIGRLFDGLAGPHGLRLSGAALDALDAHPWPGNVRELLHALRTLVALAPPGALVDDVAAVVRRPGITPPGHGHGRLSGRPPGNAVGAGTSPDPLDLDAVTADAIARALADAGGRVAEAARRLGVHRSTVYRHLAARRPAPPAGGGPR